jgi:hypothetical protein
MKSQPILEMLEPKTVERLLSRRAALKAGGAAALTVGTVPAVLAAMARTAYAQGAALPTSVIAVLNFALTLEYLEAEFYSIATGQTALPSQYTGAATALGTATTPTAVFTEIAKHENAHVRVLQAAITAGGGTPATKPTFDFTGGNGAQTAGKYTGPFLDVFTNPVTFLTLAQAFEDTGVRAYKGGAAALAAAPAILEVGLQIHSIEARHASKVRMLRGQKGWVTLGNNGVPAAAEPVYNAGSPAATYPDEDNTTQAGVNVANLTGVAGNAAAAESFDEPLDVNSVLAIAAPFIAG